MFEECLDNSSGVAGFSRVMEQFGIAEKDLFDSSVHRDACLRTKVASSGNREAGTADARTCPTEPRRRSCP
jgi:hypothetical protein